MKKLLKWALICALIFLISYGASRLYYRFTGGFTIGNISYALPYDARWEMTPLASTDSLREILNQPFHYLGKGCQSYVFESQDGLYVLKFFKYQRFRPQAWLEWLSFIPAMERYLDQKIIKKREKLEGVFISWKLAYEELRPETGVVYVHLNKSGDLNPHFLIYDKMGWKHTLNLGDYEFLLQKKATMLCPTLEQLMAQGKKSEAKQLLDQLVQMILSEYRRGLADNDHALMQNTGVLEGHPVHIDVGQFVQNDTVKDPLIYNQEIFNKTWKFRKWLKAHHPELAEHLQTLLKSAIGEQTFAKLKPRLNKAKMGNVRHAARAQ